MFSNEKGSVWKGHNYTKHWKKVTVWAFDCKPHGSVVPVNLYSVFGRLVPSFQLIRTLFPVDSYPNILKLDTTQNYFEFVRIVAPIKVTRKVHHPFYVLFSVSRGFPISTYIEISTQCDISHCTQHDLGTKRP